RIAQRRCSHSGGPCRRGTAATDPAPTMELNRVPSGSIRTHRLASVGGEKQVAMIGADHGLFNPSDRKLPNRSRQIIDDSIHHLSGLKDKSGLSSVVDLLRSNDDNFRGADPLQELGRRQTKQLVKNDVNKGRQVRRSELLTGRYIREECPFNLS